MENPSAETLYPRMMLIKTVGFNHPGLSEHVLAVFAAQKPDLHAEELRRTESRNGKYLSITVEILIISRAHLEEIYAALKTYDDVLMVL